MMRFLAMLVVVVAVQSKADEGDDILKDLQQAAQKPAAPTEANLRALVDQSLPAVARVMGVTSPSKINVKIVNRAEARTRLLAVLARDYPGDSLKRLGEALAAVGLVNAKDDLAKVAQDMYSSSVSGFYDPHDHVLYLLTDQSMESQAVIVPHELAHALQDQALSLQAVMNRLRANEDAELALSATLEGQAQQVASLVMASQLGDALGANPGEVADLLSDGAAGSAGMAAAQAPVPWLGMQMSFPYAAGAKLVAATRSPADPSAARLLKRLPSSTAQVVNPALYLRDERPKEGAFNLARLLAGSEPVAATTLGVANLQLFGQLHEQGTELGVGWRGDRIEVVHLGGRTVAVWAVNFGTSAQADRLCSAWNAVTGGKKQPDGSVYAVTRVGNTALLLENVPAADLKNVQAAAAAGFN
jgi:hypothetical protein